MYRHGISDHASINLEELVKLVSQKTGLSEAQAKMAVETVIGFLKERLPDPVASQMDSILSGTGSANLGGLLGKQ